MFTVTVMVAVVTHCPPAFGVKVYIVVTALLTAGLQVPLIALLEVAGNVNDPPEQMAGICVNRGVTVLFTVTVIVAVAAHCPVLGVKV